MLHISVFNYSPINPMLPFINNSPFNRQNYQRTYFKLLMVWCYCGYDEKLHCCENAIREIFLTTWANKFPMLGKGMERRERLIDCLTASLKDDIRPIRVTSIDLLTRYQSSAKSRPNPLPPPFLFQPQ